MLKELLEKLKDYNKCNDDLAIEIRKHILEPFQVDLSQPRKPPPTPTEFKKMAVRLAPYAMSIANQNLKTMASIRQINLSHAIFRVAINCLIDTTMYGLAALRHMSTLASIEPIEIEKTTSNLICKMVELGEVRVLFFYLFINGFVNTLSLLSIIDLWMKSKKYAPKLQLLPIFH